MTPLPTAVRVVATWLAILPVALLAQARLAPLVGTWPPPLATAAALTVAVPIAALWTVPFAMRVAARLRARLAAERGAGSGPSHARRRGERGHALLLAEREHREACACQTGATAPTGDPSTTDATATTASPGTTSASSTTASGTTAPTVTASAPVTSA